MATYSDGYEYHIHLSEGDIGRYVFLPGDPGRCETIAQHFDNPRFVASHREHTTWAGELDGVPVAFEGHRTSCGARLLASGRALGKA